MLGFGPISDAPLSDPGHVVVTSGGGGFTFRSWLLFYAQQETEGMFKNTASQKVTLFAFDSATGEAKTGDAANLTFYVSKDDGAVTALGDTSAVEDDSTNAKGNYTCDVTQAETNADKLKFTGKSSTAGIVVVPLTIYTAPNRFSTLVIDANGLADANAVKIGPTGSGTAQTAKDLGAIDVTNLNTLSGHDPGETIMGATDSVTVGTNNDKTGYSLSAAAIQAIWDALTSALTTVGSIGKLLVDNINATISSRSSHSAADVTGGTTVAAAVTALTAEHDATQSALASLVTTVGVAGAGLTDLGGMSTAMKGQVNAEADTALADYDGPTNAEMEARTLLAADYFDPAADTVANVTLVGSVTTKTGYELTSGERDAIAAALLDLADAIESGIPLRKAIRAIAARAGLLSGAGTGTEVLKGLGQGSGGTTRITYTVDASGNITAATLNL